MSFHLSMYQMLRCKIRSISNSSFSVNHRMIVMIPIGDNVTRNTSIDIDNQTISTFRILFSFRNFCFVHSGNSIIGNRVYLIFRFRFFRHPVIDSLMLSHCETAPDIRELNLNIPLFV